MGLRLRVTLAFICGAAAFIALALFVQHGGAERQLQRELRAAAAGPVEAFRERVARDLQDMQLTLAPLAGEELPTPDQLEELEGRLGAGEFAFLFEPAASAVRWRAAKPGADAASLEPWLISAPVATARSTARSCGGVVPSPAGPLLAASVELRAGFARLVLLRPLVGEAAELAGGVDFSVRPAAPATVPDDERAVFEALMRNRDLVFVETDVSTRAYARLDDPEGRAALVARALVPRSARALGAPISHAAAWMILGALLGLVGILRLLERHVLDPMQSLAQHAARIGRTNHGKVEIRLDRNDEFGQLAQELDRMVSAIDESRRHVVESARRAGMTDVSKGVVHSVGDVLTSVNVSMRLIARELGTAGIGDMRLLINELQAHKDDLGTYLTKDSNGRHLLPFLDAMTSSFEDLQARCSVELDSMEKGLSHAVELVRSIVRASADAECSEPVDLCEIVDLALSIARLARGGAAGVVIDRDYRRPAIAHLDRHGLTSVMIHVVGNALDALDSVEGEQRRLELAVFPSGEDRIVIEVADRGTGIAPDNLDRIFDPGFTTKPEGTGQGLHTVANVCREMGISIGGSSDGLGHGATFKLRVPIQSPSVDGAGEAPAAALPSLGGGPAQFDRRKTGRSDAV